MENALASKLKMGIILSKKELNAERLSRMKTQKAGIHDTKKLS